MSFDPKPLQNFLVGLLTMWWDQLRAAFSSALESTDAPVGADHAIDPDFKGWLHNDPLVTGNPASRYGDDAPGYLTGNGLGSLEIGAADD